MIESLVQIMWDNEFLDQVKETLMPIIWDSTVPIVAEQDGALRQHATGTLLRIADRYFLVTAWHPFADVKQVNGVMRILTRGKPVGLVPVGGDVVWARSDGEDWLDVGILELTDKVSEIRDYKPVCLADIDIPQEVQDDMYVVAGYPCILSKAGTVMDANHMSWKRCWMLTYPFRGETRRFGSYRADHHILLDLRREHAVVIDGDGAVPRSLVGISGASIWKTNVTKVGRSNWTPAHAKITAVQTMEYSDAGVLRGTMWFEVAHVIHQIYPELQPALRLWFRPV